MTDKRDIAEFLETMDHEFPNIELQVNKAGYKVDGNDGIKKQCGLNNLKSVDYFYLYDRKFFVIEFSDFLRQRIAILNDVEAIKETTLDKNQKKRLVKEHHKKIHKELVEKYKDSVHILNLMGRYSDQIPAEFAEQGRAFLIVVPPILQHLPPAKRVQMLRYLKELRDKVSQAIPDDIYQTVKLVFVDQFAA